MSSRLDCGPSGSNLFLRKALSCGLDGFDLENVRLEAGDTIYEIGSEIDYIYFPRGAVVSLICVTRDGEMAEMATVGREGAVGVVGSFGRGRAISRWAVQILGEADRVATFRLRAAFADNERLRHLIMSYIEALHAQALQSVACNALHIAEARCCRWLLTMRDSTGSNMLPVTQDLIAVMLGVHRPTVTNVFKKLTGEGIIRCRRGQIEVINCEGLARLSCECYQVIREYYEYAVGDLNC